MATKKSGFDNTERLPSEERAPSIVRPFLRNDRLRFLTELLPMGVILVGFFFVPLLGIVLISFTKTSPFGIQFEFSIQSYRTFFTTYRFSRLITTIGAAVIQVVVAFVIGFPLAYYTGIRKRNSPFTFPLLLLFAIPFITNYILRTLSWISVLGREGVVNTILTTLGIINGPLDWLLYSEFAVHVGMAASYVPFLLFPTWLAMNRIEDDVLRASADVGATPLQTIRYIVLPLSMPGIVIGAVFVFVGVLGESVIPALLGGPNVTFVASTISSAVSSLALPLASAISTVIMAIAAVIILLWEYVFGLQSIGEI